MRWWSHKLRSWMAKIS